MLENISKGKVHLLAEGPVWSRSQAAYLYVDILKGEVFRVVEGLPPQKIFQIEDFVSAVLPTSSPEKLLLLFKNRVALLDLSTESVDIVGELPGDNPNVRFNDAKCDSRGYLWAGTMHVEGQEPVGNLFCFSIKKGFIEKQKNCLISNGLGWSPDNQWMYFTDSGARTIYKYKFVSETQNISDRQVFVQLEEGEGDPDGLAVDSEGNVWSAQWDGWKVRCYSPEGEVKQVLEVPVQRPTSCCFGGAQGNEMLITTASIDLAPDELEKCPAAGSIFKVMLPTKGLPLSTFNLEN